jgi:DNA-binding transcriptional regulator YiaG
MPLGCANILDDHHSRWHARGMNNEELLLLREVREATRSGRARRIRELAVVPQSAIAQAVGVSESAVSRWENGKRAPRGAAALAYGRALQELSKA